MVTDPTSSVSLASNLEISSHIQPGRLKLLTDEEHRVKTHLPLILIYKSCIGLLCYSKILKFKYGMLNEDTLKNL